MIEIGIDLGTSNSLIGYFNSETNEAQLIPNRFGSLLTPSVISLDEDDAIIVGEIAKARKITYPDRTASAFKRFMGTEKEFMLDKRKFSPVELSSFVLTSLKTDAEAFLKTEITDVVISVPAYFNAFQREATISAAKLAGLSVRQLISEPTAASIAYGIENSEEDQNFLVVDLGGGTFDVSLISLFEQIIQVEAISGDSQLGGEDFTFALVDAALEKVGMKREKAPVSLISELYAKAENMKQKFSEALTLSASFDFEYEGETRKFMLTAVEFRELIMPLLARLQRPTKRVMNDSNIDFEELDKVILVGGATRTLVVQQAFEKITDIKPSDDLNPDEAIALGATIRAHMLNDKSREELIMTDVIGFSLGTAVLNHEETGKSLFMPIIERNTVIPTSMEKRVVKSHAQQKTLEIPIYQGEKPYAKDNLKLGAIQYPCAKLNEHDLVSIRYSYDESGILEVDVTDEKQKLHKNLVIQNRNVKLSDAELDKIKKKLSTLKINPLEQDENKLILARFEQIYAEFIGEQRE